MGCLNPSFMVVILLGNWSQPRLCGHGHCHRLLHWSTKVILSLKAFYMAVHSVVTGKKYIGLLNRFEFVPGLYWKVFSHSAVGRKAISILKPFESSIGYLRRIKVTLFQAVKFWGIWVTLHLQQNHSYPSSWLALIKMTKNIRILFFIEKVMKLLFIWWKYCPESKNKGQPSNSPPAHLLIKWFYWLIKRYCMEKVNAGYKILLKKPMRFWEHVGCFRCGTERETQIKEGDCSKMKLQQKKIYSV